MPAKPKKDKTEPAPVGRPTKYEADYAEQGYKLCLLGATDKELADFFEVSEATLNNWKHEHPKFLESIKKGKDHADSNVADRLYQRATGFNHPEEQIFQFQGQVVRAQTVKQYAPDTVACIFWLKNRQKGKWRDKQDHEVTGKDGAPIDHSLTVKFVDGSRG